MDTRKQIKLADVACVDNRKMTGIEELAANIDAIGLLQPILLTTEPEDSQGGKIYGVVDGRRRFRALEQLKREYLEPGQYVIFQGKVGQERQAAFSANFARQQLTLQEEVEALKNLGGSRSSIAALLGKTEQWVALRQNLANLTGEWIDILNNPEYYPQWTPAKLELIARESPKAQKNLEWLTEDIVSIDELKGHIAENHMELSDAPFAIDGCKNCPKRSASSASFGRGATNGSFTPCAKGRSSTRRGSFSITGGCARTPSTTICRRCASSTATIPGRSSPTSTSTTTTRAGCAFRTRRESNLAMDRG